MLISSEIRSVLFTAKPKEAVMILTEASEVSRALAAAWKKLVHETEEAKREASLAYQRTLVKQLIEPEVVMHAGQLILFFHEFLTMRSTGEHSFVHGSAMCSDTIYWVTVGRMKGEKIIETAESGASWGPSEGLKIHFVTPPQFLLPVEWQMQLQSIYPGNSHRPSYTAKSSGKHRRASDSMPRNTPLDLSAFGQHLFRAHEAGKHDWATHFAVAIGDEAVQRWLTEQHSAEAYQELKEHSFA